MDYEDLGGGARPERMVRFEGSPIPVAVVENVGGGGGGSALRQLVDSVPGLRCVGRAWPQPQGWRSPSRQQPEVVLVDSQALSTPEWPGLESVRRSLGDPPILVVARVLDRDRLLAAIRAGARGCIVWQTPPDAIADAVRQLRDGRTPLAPAIARLLIGALQSESASLASCSALNQRERRLLKLLADGRSYTQAAAALGVGVNTVRSNIRALYDKLDVHTRSEAVAKALRGGLIV